jgi:hypothetical protein
LSNGVKLGFDHGVLIMMGQMPLNLSQFVVKF